MVRRQTLIGQHHVAGDGLAFVSPASTTNDDTDARQANGVRAHDARLDAGVEGAAGQIAGASPGERGSQRFHFRVSRRIMPRTHRFNPFGHELVFLNDRLNDQ
jgi:hypothetical protein